MLILLGPTASGKTSVIETIYDGRFEVVTADSMQAYRGLDVGTAKPSPETLRRIPHHLVDILDPREQYTCGEFVRRADEAADQIVARGRLPVVSGGTAYYIRGFLYGLPESPRGEAAERAALERELQTRGLAALYEELARLDPATAAKVHANDRYRILRALEILRASGRPRSSFVVPDVPRRRWSFVVLGLMPRREELESRIRARVHTMFAQGLVSEVKGLLRAGYGPRDPGMRGIGYRELLAMRRGCLTLGQVQELVAANTVRFAKRQMTFFRAFPEVRWIDAGDAAPVAEALRGAES